MVERICQTCGKTFEAKITEVNRRDGVKYCSKTCCYQSPKWRDNIRKSRIGQTAGEKHPLWGKHHSEETKRKWSEKRKGKQTGEKHPLWGKHHSEETKKRWSEKRRGKQTGKDNPRWNGGKKLSNARRHKRRNNKGFVLLTEKNPYSEPIEYHHIHPDLPYVVPCPTRIHKMFPGSEKDKTHFQNVNAMLGIKIEI